MLLHEFDKQVKEHLRDLEALVIADAILDHLSNEVLSGGY